MNDEEMDRLTVRDFESKFDNAVNLFGWIYGGKSLQLESAADEQTKILNQIKFEVL